MPVNIHASILSIIFQGSVLMAIQRKQTNILEKDFLLIRNPFASGNIYNLDEEHTYVPEIYGNHRVEFFEKFFLTPLESDRNRQVIGAVWSSHTADGWGKGYGKSMIMAEESKRINSDLGSSMLREFEVNEDDVLKNPILSGYCSFDLSKGVTTFPSALLDAVAFILSSPCNLAGEEVENEENGVSSWNVHQELRSRILNRSGSEGNNPSSFIMTALTKELRRYQGLNIQLNHHTLAAFISELSFDDTDQLVGFIRNNIGPRIKASQGFNFVHVFNAFARLAGVDYIVYFIDQVENFARFTNKQERDIRIVREAICQTSPTSEIASFIFQMHIHALQEIEHWWHLEDMPSLDVNSHINRARIVDLDGLDRQATRMLVQRYLESARIPGVVPENPIHPFSEDIIEQVRDHTNGNPRHILNLCGNILLSAQSEHRGHIDLSFVESLLNIEGEEDEPIDTRDDDDFDNPARG